MEPERRSELDGQDTPESPRTLNRREFVKRMALATAGAGFLTAAFRGYILSPTQREEVAEAVTDKIGKLPKRHLGTHMGPMMITPIVICQDWAPDLYAPGLAAGINYVHKAGYWNELPEAFKKIPRESYYTDVTVDSTPRHPDDEDRAYNQVNESLKKNGLKYYDIFRAHFGWNSVDEMRTKKGTYRAYQRLKREGKVRFFGCTQHPYLPYAEILPAMVEDGLIDTVQIFYAYGSSKDDRDAADKAHRAGIGMVSMKGFANGQRAMRRDTNRMAALKASGQVGKACYRHVLSEKGSDGKPIFTACVSAIQNFSQFEENLGAVSTKVAAVEGFDILV